MRYTNIENGLDFPTTPSEMEVIAARFVKRCNYYYPLVRAQYEKADSQVDYHFRPYRNTGILRSHGKGRFHSHPSQNIFDAPLDNQRLRFTALGSPSRPGKDYITYLYRPPEEATKRIPEQTEEINWARYSPRIQEATLFFRTRENDVYQRVKGNHTVQTSKRSLDFPIALDQSLTMPAKQWAAHFAERDPPLSSVEQERMERFGPYALLHGQVSAMLGGLAIIAGEDPRQAGGPPIMYSSDDPWQNNI